VIVYLYGILTASKPRHFNRYNQDDGMHLTTGTNDVLDSERPLSTATASTSVQGGDPPIQAKMKDIQEPPRLTSAVLHRSLRHSPLQVTSASGQYLLLSNGQKVLDATGGAAVACLGHGNER
jgi:hypothetical protein